MKMITNGDIDIKSIKCIKDKLLEMGFKFKDLIKGKIKEKTMKEIISSCNINKLITPKLAKKILLSEEIFEKMGNMIKDKIYRKLLIKEKIKQKGEKFGRKLKKEDISDEDYEYIPIERGLLVCEDKKGNLYPLREIISSVGHISLTGVLNECKEKGKEIHGVFHTHPNNLILPTGMDIKTLFILNNIKRMFIGGEIEGNPLINIIYLKDNINISELSDEMKILDKEIINMIEEYKPKTKKIIIESKYVPEEERLKLLMLRGKIPKYFSLEKKEFSDKDLEDINKKGKEIYSKYFNVVTLEL